MLSVSLGTSRASGICLTDGTSAGAFGFPARAGRNPRLALGDDALAPSLPRLYPSGMPRLETAALPWWTAGVLGPRRQEDRARRSLRPSADDPLWLYRNAREVAVVLDVPGHDPRLLEPGEAFEFRADGWYTMAVGDPERHRGTFAVGRVARLAPPIS